MNLRFLCAPKENDPKEKALFPEAFFACSENQLYFSKIPPGLRDFFTKSKVYAAEKEFKKHELKRQNTNRIKSLFKASS